MKIVGIIAEYNPFHNGHQYQIEQALKVTGSDAAVIIMSGDFVQRGAPSIAPKQLRARAALLGGASLVLELPVLFACSSAEFFARGAVGILNGLGCISSLCFGSESGDIEKLTQIARILADEPYEYRTFLQRELKKGSSFPQARQIALREYTKSPELAEILSSPNNTLGIEYLKALLHFQSPIKPYTITRQQSGYHDTSLRESFSSATAIRNYIGNVASAQDAFASVENQLPFASLELLRQNYGQTLPVTADDFSILLKYRLLLETASSLTDYLDVSEDLANRIINKRNQFRSWSSFCDLLKTKELTYTRISRALLHILLQIKKDSLPAALTSSALYARTLGFRKKDAQILKEIKINSTLPLITKLADTGELPSAAKQLLALDIFSTNLYQSILTEKFASPNQTDHQIPLQII